MTESTETHCRWAGSESPRLLRSHLRDCESASCRGCQPCGERHCRRCGKEHVTDEGRGSDHTCGACLLEARQDLQHCWVTVELIAEALMSGVASEAAMLIGPAAEDLSVWQRRHRLIVNAAMAAPEHPHHPARRALAAWMADCRDERHPLWVLGTWERLVREHLGLDEPADRVTGSAARAFLDLHLTRLAHDPEFPFEDLAEELGQCRTHLEDAARNSRRLETGAPCIACGRAELVKDYGKTAADQVKWTCPKCGQWWDEESYRSKVAAVYLTKAAALTASQIAAVYRVPEGTVRQWALRGHVSKRGFDAQRRQLYDVADTLAKRDETQTA
jgi:transposase-like protein